MGRILIDDYNGRVAKEQDVMECPICDSAPPREEFKIVGYLDVYNGIVREGLAGTLLTASNRAFIIERMEKKILSYSRDSSGDVVNRNVRDVAGTVHTKEGACGNTAQFVLEPRIEQVGNLVTGKGKFDNPMRGRVYSTGGLSPTLTGHTGGNLEPKIIQRPRGRNKGGEHELSPTIDSSAFADNNLLAEGFSVRKLTPRECFRLMDVSDGDIEKIQASGVSKSQQYHMAGNSIVVSVLFHIFRKMFAEPRNDNGELELF